MNMLNQLQANDYEKQQAAKHFECNTVTHAAVVDYIQALRKNNLEANILQ
jgi:hydroxymethylglutaryl-CoA reductase